jgi:hypothetical protein
MSRHKKSNRAKEIDRRRQRQAKLARLRERYTSAKNESERKEVFALVTRRVPWLTPEEFVTPSTAGNSH